MSQIKNTIEIKIEKSSQLTDICYTLSMSQKNNFPEFRTTHLIFPNQTNHYGTLFGGVALEMMDTMAFIAATRSFRRMFVTASSDKIDFKAPVKVGQLAELTGRVIKKGQASCTVEVLLYSEDLLTGTRVLSTRGLFVMVSIDKKQKPVKI